MNKSLLFSVALLSVAGASAQQRVSEQAKQMVQFTAPVQDVLNQPVAERVAQMATAEDWKALASSKASKAAANVAASYLRPAGVFWYPMNKAGQGYYFPLWQTAPFVETSFINTTAASEEPAYNWAVQLYDRSNRGYAWFSSTAKNISISQINGEMDSVPELTATIGAVKSQYSIYGYRWSGNTLQSQYRGHLLASPTTGPDGALSTLSSPLLATSHNASATATSQYSWGSYTGAKDADGGKTGRWFGRNESGINLVGAAFEKPEHPYVLNKVYGRVGLCKVKSGATVTLTAKVYKLDKLEPYIDTTAVVYDTEDIAKLEDNIIASGTATIDASTAQNSIIEFPLTTEIEGIPMEITPEIDSPILVCITGYNDPNVTDITFYVTDDKTNEGHGEVAFLGYATGSVPSKIIGLHNFFKSGADMYNGMSILLGVEHPFIVYNYNNETGEVNFPAAGGSKSVEIYSYKNSEDWNTTLVDGSDVPDWLHISYVDGEGDDEGLVTATVKADAYPAGQNGGRRADVKFGFPGAHLTYIVRQNDQSGVDEVTVSGVQAYAANGNLYVNVKGAENAGELSIYNVAGKLVKTAVLSEGTNILDAQDLAKGVYMLQFGNNTVKVVK